MYVVCVYCRNNSVCVCKDTTMSAHTINLLQEEEERWREARALWPVSRHSTTKRREKESETAYTFTTNRTKEEEEESKKAETRRFAIEKQTNVSDFQSPQLLKNVESLNIINGRIATKICARCIHKRGNFMN